MAELVNIFLETPLELKIILLSFAVGGFLLCWATKRDERNTFNERYSRYNKWRKDDQLICRESYFELLIAFSIIFLYLHTQVDE